MFSAIADFKEKLRQGDVLLGTTLAFTDPMAADALADTFDFIWIDQEHTAISPEALRNHLIVLRAKNTPTLVRVSGTDTALIKPVLDAGACGIIVPQICTVEEVERIVADCRYPPIGQRGFGPLVPSNYGRNGGSEYVNQANAHIFAAVMIETRQAVDNIDAIVRVPGLDGVCLGPWDLSGSLGHLGQVDHPDVVRAIEKVIASASAVGLPVGSGLPVDAEFAILQAQRGIQFLQIGGDCSFMVQAADDLTAVIRKKLA